MNSPFDREADTVASGRPAVAQASKRYFRGTHRTCEPEETLARVQPLLQRMGITRIANVTGLDRTGLPVVTVARPNARSVTVAQGKGLTLAAAKVSGVMEAIEVWHAERIVKPLKLARHDEMRSEHRLADVTRLPLARGSRFNEQLPMLWMEGVDLLGGGAVWVPFELVSANYTLPLPPGCGCFQANTNGLASGNHYLEAVSHGLCEVVERDARTLWGHRAAEFRGRRVVDLQSITDADCRGVLERFLAANLQARVWDVTSDVGIASFVCLIMGLDGDDADPEFGAGCHPVREIALLRALTEAAQARNTYITGARDDYHAALYSAACRAQRRKDCLRLLEANEAPRNFAHVPSFDSASIDADLRCMLARLRAVGIEQVITVDLTRETIGVPVVRVIVPGLEGAMDKGQYAPGQRARRCLLETH